MQQEIIHAWIFDPRDAVFKEGKAQKARVNIITCSNKDNCNIYKKGQCVRLIRDLFGSTHCPHGTTGGESGLTQRASGLGAWIRKKNEEYSMHIGRLKSASKQVEFAGDYVFLPYNRMNWNIVDGVVRFEPAPFGGKHTMLERKFFTVEVIIKLLRGRPYDAMGGATTEYHLKTLPKFAFDLSRNMPDLFNQVASQYPAILELASSLSFVGKKALLSSLRPGIKIKCSVHKTIWVWDGEYLYSETFRPSFIPVQIESASTKLKPKQGSVIVIHSNEQVDEDTLFTD